MLLNIEGRYLAPTTSRHGRRIVRQVNFVPDWPTWTSATDPQCGVNPSGRSARRNPNKPTNTPTNTRTNTRRILGSPHKMCSGVWVFVVLLIKTISIVVINKTITTQTPFVWGSQKTAGVCSGVCWGACWPFWVRSWRCGQTD